MSAPVSIDRALSVLSRMFPDPAPEVRDLSIHWESVLGTSSILLELTPFGDRLAFIMRVTVQPICAQSREREFCATIAQRAHETTEINTTVQYILPYIKKWSWEKEEVEA